MRRRQSARWMLFANQDHFKVSRGVRRKKKRFLDSSDKNTTVEQVFIRPYYCKQLVNIFNGVVSVELIVRMRKTEKSGLMLKKKLSVTFFQGSGSSCRKVNMSMRANDIK